MAVYLVCEGSGSRLDERILDALVVQYSARRVLMASVGGRRGHGAVRAFLENRSSNDVAASIEDRDYRPRATAQKSWVNPAGKRFIWPRHEIENYLLHPRIVLELFHDFRAAPNAAWAMSLPATEADVSALLQSLALPLLDTHAAEVLIEEIRRKLSDSGSVYFSLQRPAPHSGAHEVGQAQWLSALHQETTRLCQTYRIVAALPELQPAAITARYPALLAQFQRPDFLASDDYLIDMAGKELLAALSRHLSGLGAPSGLNRDFLANELLRVLARIYQPNAIYTPDDFSALANVLTTY